LHFTLIVTYINSPKNHRPTIMKQNVQFIVVIFFVTLAFLVMLNDVTNNKNGEYQNSVELFQTSDQSNIATTDLIDEE